MTLEWTKVVPMLVALPVSHHKQNNYKFSLEETIFNLKSTSYILTTKY